MMNQKDRDILRGLAAQVAEIAALPLQAEKRALCRKVSMSPWVNEERGAEAIGGDFVCSRKPNPALLAMGKFDPELIRASADEHNGADTSASQCQSALTIGINTTGSNK